ncbi:MAG TPA: hypothetical protein VHW90_15000, partial [Stellaceae bacterium]|nr:hypothetical protein [Stellaceae bacterium]
LLTLFVVGTASREYIAKHKRLQHFNATDYDLLFDNISRVPAIIVTPNTLTETFNWVKMIGEPAREHIAVTFLGLIGALEERYVPSRTAAAQTEFPRLWLTDSALLSELGNGHVLLTTDFALYDAALRRGHVAYNFNHLRQL